MGRLNTKEEELFLNDSEYRFDLPLKKIGGGKIYFVLLYIKRRRLPSKVLEPLFCKSKS